MNDSSSSSFKESVVSEDTEVDTARKTFAKKVTDSNLCPFKLEWSLGINSKVPLINLTTANRTLIAYACSHTVMLYNYVSKESLPLQGHQNAVETLSISADGKWLMTADFEEDSVVVVWDTENGVPICTLFNPHSDKGMTAARISPNAKYIVTVGNEQHQKVLFWLWTYGKDKPDASIELVEDTSDRVKEIHFNQDVPEEFVLTTEHSVFFFTWKHGHLRYVNPKIMRKVRRLGVFNCSCYVPKTAKALTATTNGFVLVWSNAVDKKFIAGRGETINREKKHVKSVQLQKSSITVLLYHDGMIITGNSIGRISFYDCQLRILYWCQNCGLDSIRSISFDLQSQLLCPSFASESELEFGEEDDMEEEIEFEEESEREEQIPRLQNVELKTSMISINIEHAFRIHGRKENLKEDYSEALHAPVDATLRAAPFVVGNFFACTLGGVVALIEISKLKCHFVSQHLEAPITSLDAHPESNYVVTGNSQGLLSLYDYQKRILVVSRKAPQLPDFQSILDIQAKKNNIIYVTCPQTHENLTAITVLKYSPKCDMLACGMENGAVWILHPITLDPLDNIPYKHSSESILKLIFTNCSEYMAYSDNTLMVAVFKRNEQSLKSGNLWNFVGKYRSHSMTIRDILFGPTTADNVVPRLLSLGEDQDLVEYDLQNSGPYPDPGLKILQVNRIEYSAVPLCLAWYPRLGVESFLITSNSEYKYRLLNDTTKMIRGTFLGPAFGAPVQQFQVLHGKDQDSGYIVFATDKEIGLQLIPIDGNPYKITGIVGHPRKITNIAVSWDSNHLFTVGYNDPCVLTWKIKRRSVDVMARLGGKGLSPFYCLIEGGRSGWLINEMQDLFYYAQILHQGENTTATRVVSDKVITKQIPNLMRAIGYYPSNEELEIILAEVSYKIYAETGQLVEEITFQDFVKLYINHRPAFGLSMRQIKEAFTAFQSPDEQVDNANPTLTRKRFMEILFGKGLERFSENEKLYGEPLTIQEAYFYMKLLVSTDDNLDDVYLRNNKTSVPFEFNFLPERISYKDFTTDIMGIELPEETRADNE